MKIKRRFGKIHADFEIIPFVNLLFQVVLLFFVSTAFFTPADKSGLHLSLSSEQSVNTGVFVVLNGGSSVSVNGREVALDALDNLFISYPIPENERAGFPVTVEMQAASDEGVLTKVFKVLENSGFTNVNFFSVPDVSAAETE